MLDKKLDEAENAYVQGDYRQAIAVARDVLKVDAKNAKATRIIGASACQLGDKERAKWAHRRLPPSEQKLLEYVCKRNNVTLP
jgi:Flp pilus assembly protein TadD